MAMGVLPPPIEELLDSALVGELTVVDGHGRPVTGVRAGGGGAMSAVATDPLQRLLAGLEGSYTHAVIAFLDDAGYPMSVASNFAVDEGRGVVRLDVVVGEAAPPLGREVNVV